MSQYSFELEELFYPSQMSNLFQKSLFEEYDKNINGENYQFSQEQKHLEKDYTKNHQEAKNIPKNMGILIKNYFVNNYKEIARQNQTVKKFINKVNNKRNYTRKDLKVLFSNEQARTICKEYFSSFQIIQDILKSTKIRDSEVILKYIKKLFIGTQDPQSLQCLKYADSNFDYIISTQF